MKEGGKERKWGDIEREGEREGKVRKEGREGEYIDVDTNVDI